MWTRFSKEAKEKYKALAKKYNIINRLTGRRKSTGFWLFAHELVTELRKPQVRSAYIQEKFKELNEKAVHKFAELNVCSVTARNNYIRHVVLDEAYFLLQ